MTSIRVVATMHDRAETCKNYLPGDENNRWGSKEVEAREVLGGLALVDNGSVKTGRAVYHVPSGQVIPARVPGVRNTDLVDGTSGLFRTLKAARGFMKDVHEAGILDGEPVTEEQIKELKEWLSGR